MEDSIITVVYGIAQVLNFGAIYPVIRTVYRSKTAEAICLPAVIWYTINGVIISAYMIESGCGVIIAAITIIQLVLFNVALGTLTYYKQKKAR